MTTKSTVQSSKDTNKDLGKSGAPITGYAPVNGLQMYYEIHGTGSPLLLLHGNLSGIGTSFGAVLPAFAQDRQVIAVEQQAQGRTADIDRPLSVQQMAEDTVALLRHLQIGQTDIFGYSMGSAVATQIAIDHPEQVRKLVLASPTYNRGGFQPGVLEGISGLKPEHLAGSPFEAEYASTAPRPEDWPVLIEKVKELDSNIPEWTPEVIQAIQAPVLLLFGDADIVRPEHAVAMFRLLGGGTPEGMMAQPRSRLAILPATTHMSIMQRAGWLVSMVTEFLDAP